ncbi:hypothetical protein RMATCC62417_08478 [Rhizopus microsporus]|nr:hypothetical protein RMATCC62417_08478 [Rhizopus microsporus]
MTFIKDPLAVDCGLSSLFAQTQTNLFKYTSFEANDDYFQETPLLRKDKNIRTTLKATKEDTSAPGPSNVVINEKTSMPAVNKDTSVQALHFCSHQGKVDKAEALKKEKEKNKAIANEQKQVRCPSCGGTDHSRSSSKLCPMNKSKMKLSKPKDTVEKVFVIKTSLANICKYPKFVTLIQEVVDHITQLVYAGSIFTNYYFLELLENSEELPVKVARTSFCQEIKYKKVQIIKGKHLDRYQFNKSLEVTSKLKNIDKKDIDAVQTFIKTVQDKTFMPLKYTDPRGSRYFSLLPLYKSDSKSIQIDAQSFWKLAK